MALAAPDYAEQAKKASEKDGGQFEGFGRAFEAWEHAKKLKKASKDVGKIAEEVKASSRHEW